MAFRLFLAASIVALLAACATTRMSDAETLALYRAHAGEPLRTVRYYDPVSWEEVDEDHLLLTMRPREVYLLRISGPCLDWGGASPTIAISSQAGFVSAGFDRVSVPGVPAGCRIEEIRPVDIAAVRAARERMTSR